MQLRYLRNFFKNSSKNIARMSNILEASTSSIKAKDKVSRTTAGIIGNFFNFC